MCPQQFPAHPLNSQRELSVTADGAQHGFLVRMAAAILWERQTTLALSAPHWFLLGTQECKAPVALSPATCRDEVTFPPRQGQAGFWSLHGRWVTHTGCPSVWYKPPACTTLARDGTSGEGEVNQRKHAAPAAGHAVLCL